MPALGGATRRANGGPRSGGEGEVARGEALQKRRRKVQKESVPDGKNHLKGVGTARRERKGRDE